MIFARLCLPFGSLKKSFFPEDLGGTNPPDNYENFILTCFFVLIIFDGGGG